MALYLEEDQNKYDCNEISSETPPRYDLAIIFCGNAIQNCPEKVCWRRYG